MMQPPLWAAARQLQPRSRVSWFIPKLWPSSCARVTAAPRGLSEWSSEKKQEHRRTAQALGLTSNSFLLPDTGAPSTLVRTHSPSQSPLSSFHPKDTQL